MGSQKISCSSDQAIQAKKIEQLQVRQYLKSVWKNLGFTEQIVSWKNEMFHEANRMTQLKSISKQVLWTVSQKVQVFNAR